MASDGRWTGGAANREWQRGMRAEQVVTAEIREHVMRQVRRYLSDCREHAAMLRASDHPTPEGALKIVYGPRAAVLACYREATCG